MMQKKQTEKKRRRASLDRFLALHQPHCTLFVVGTAVVGELAILRFCRDAAVEWTAPLALFLYAVYLYCTRAPQRALNRVMQDLTLQTLKEGFDFVWGLEKALPFLKRKEMAFSILTAKAVLLTRIGKFDDAIRLLRSFDQVWNEAQRESLRSLVRQIEEVKEKIQHVRKEEN